MSLNERQIEVWMERGGRFFKATSRNPVIRGELLSRGLTDQELEQGWRLYAELHGFDKGTLARRATPETAAAQAMNAVDDWDAPAFAAAEAVLGARFPQVKTFLFANLQASVGIAAVAGVELFLDRIAMLREGKVDGIEPEAARAAVTLLELRKILDPAKEQELRQLIQTVRVGARPDEVVQPTQMDPRRLETATEFIKWLTEWREVARVAIKRRDYRISLGLARRKTENGQEPKDEDEEKLQTTA
jgi:hypothetical protein